MTLLQIFLTVSCVLVISLGQLLFKKVSININQSSDFLSYSVLGTFSLAIAIYGFATIFWIYILRNVPLNQAYSFMALSFVFVALGSFIFFDEKISLQFFIGLLFIIIGLIVISNA